MTTQIIRDDILSFCSTYTGPKFHALLCDPPYELGFMGKAWDKSGIVFDPATWEALTSHLLPGAFGMAFASSRGWHRLACAIEDAGLRIHPSIFGWVFGSGFPKATRIDTQIDKAAGVEREVVEYSGTPSGFIRHGRTDEEVFMGNDKHRSSNVSIPSTDLAKAWSGHRYGLQALKPALEPIIVFQKPYEGKPVECIVETGAGALNIDVARIQTTDKWPGTECDSGPSIALSGGVDGSLNNMRSSSHPQGRWPANFYVLPNEETYVMRGEPSEMRDCFEPNNAGGSLGTSARFFFNVNRQLDEADPVLYCAKASRKERDAGLDNIPLSVSGGMQGTEDQSLLTGSGNIRNNKMRNAHPTVKPIDLTRWLATLLLPPAEYAPRRILVPFSGSGSEMIGAHLAGWEEIVGIEMEQEYVEIAEARLKHWTTSKGFTERSLIDNEPCY